MSPRIIASFDGEYRFLSNFYMQSVEFEGEQYPSVEHAFQAAKTSDRKERETVRLAATPGLAKRVGGKVALRLDWNKTDPNGRLCKVNIMRDLLKKKFTPGTDLANRLLHTGDAALVEGNNWNDKFWGVCDGVGDNWLGRLLMEIREELRWGNWRRDTRRSSQRDQETSS